MPKTGRLRTVLKNPKKLLALGLALVLLAGGGYLLLLSLSPHPALISIIPSSIDLDTSDDSKDKRNRIQIPKINLEVPYFTGDLSVLEKGAWHRYPERGDPKKGGNFILSAHRFYIGRTPQGTRERSPFYNLEELEVGDKIRVSFESSWYEYKVSAKYKVKPDAVEIEAATDSARLTLYTCTLQGSADGRVVIEALPV